jgi:hypothetical protein
LILTGHYIPGDPTEEGETVELTVGKGGPLRASVTSRWESICSTGLQKHKLLKTNDLFVSKLNIF